jgi:glycosyltransferase involved in cell wall biosynthesis
LFFKQLDNLEVSHRIEKTKSDIQEIIVYHKELSALQSYKFKKKILKEILSEIGQPDIIHLHILAADQLIFARFAIKNRIPFFVSEHWSGYVTSGFKNIPKVKRLIYKRITKRAKAILPVSKFLEEGMRSSGLKGNYSVVPNIVDLPEVVSSKNKAFSFIVVSDIVDEVKNISGIVTAFQEIKTDKSKIRLSIVGDGPDFRQIKSLINLRPDGIELLGRLPNNEALVAISKAHCLVVNSNVETFSVVSIEARAQGLQVIATDCGGPPEYADDFTLIIQKNNLEDLKTHMLFALEKSNIPKRVIQEFSRSSIGTSLFSLYEFYA